MTAPEFSRSVRLTQIGQEPSSHTVVADARERTALAVRFALVAIDRLDAEIGLWRDGDAVVAEGRVRGDVVQDCAASGVPVPAAIDAPLFVRFSAETPAGDEIELDGSDCDEMPHDGHVVDIGEAAAQTLALALDPYPRAPGSGAALEAAGVIGEDEAATGPFATLGKLLRQKT